MIKDNPFRVLGVVANTSGKEIQKNLSKLNAHLSIEKELKLCFDQVIELRKFRDEVLSKSFLGRVFIKVYYKTSPIMVRNIKKQGGN